MVGDAFGSDLRTSRYELAPEYFVSVRRAHVPLVGVKEVAGAADAAGCMGEKGRELDCEQGSILVFESCHLDIGSFLIGVQGVNASGPVLLYRTETCVEA